METSEEHKLGERRMRELVAIVESSDDAIVGKTLEGIVTSWNRGAQRLFGYRAEEAIGQPVSRIIPEDRLEEETQIITRLRRGERVEHFETVRRRILEVNAGITERKRAEEGLRESQARFERVIESAMDAIVSIDETQRVVL